MAANIIRGKDKKFVIKLRQANGDPYPNLPTANQVTVNLPNFDGTTLSINLDPIPAQPASVEYAGVIFTAVSAGKLGNLISFMFDGVTDIHDTLAAWNAANLSNQVTSNAPDDTVVPAAGAVHLQNGSNLYSKVSIVSPASSGFLLITLPGTDTQNLKQGNLLSISVEPALNDDDVGDERGINIPNAINVADAS